MEKKWIFLFGIILALALLCSCGRGETIPSTAEADQNGGGHEGISDRNLLTGYDGSTELRGEDLVAETAEILRDIVKDFVLEEYSADVSEQGNGRFTIDYYKRISGFITDSAYTVSLNNNSVTAVYDNTHDLPKDTAGRLSGISKRLGIPDQQEQEMLIKIEDHSLELPENTPEELRNALQTAFEQTQAADEKEATELKFQYYYDSASDKACILVYTTYYYDGTETLGVDAYTYVIPE